MLNQFSFHIIKKVHVPSSSFYENHYSLVCTKHRRENLHHSNPICKAGFLYSERTVTYHFMPIHRYQLYFWNAAWLKSPAGKYLSDYILLFCSLAVIFSTRNSVFNNWNIWVFFNIRSMLEVKSMVLFVLEVKRSQVNFSIWNTSIFKIIR